MYKKLQENIINDNNEDFQNSNQDFKKSEGKFTIISNDSIHKSNIKSDSIDIEESNNTLNDNKRDEEEDEEDEEFEEERIRAFNEIMNKKERPVEVIKEVDEEYDSDFHMSPIKNNKDYHNENNIHKNDNLGFKKLDFDINDNKNKNNNYSNFNVENNEKNINNNNNNNYNFTNDNNSNEDYNKENINNNDNYQNNFQNNISPIKDDKFLESQSDIVNQKNNYSPIITDANNIQIQTPNFINEKIKFEEKKIPSGDIEKIDIFIKMLRIKKNQNIYYENKNNHNKEKEKEEEEEKKKQNYIENRRKKMEDIKNIFLNKTKEKKNYEEEKNNVNKKSKFKELVKITNSVPSILSNPKKNLNKNPIKNNFLMTTQRKKQTPKKNINIKQIYSRRNIINENPLSNNYYINNNNYQNYYNNTQKKLYELDYDNNKKDNKSLFKLIENDFLNFDDGYYNINKIYKGRNIQIKENPKCSERTFKRGYIMPVNPMDGIISAKASILWD